MTGGQCLVTALSVCLLAAGVSARESGIESTDAPVILEEVVIIGTRIEGRSVTHSPVPVDLITSEDLLRTGQLEIGRAIQRLIPSFNFSSSTISDGTDAVRPATLRGLGPDQVLVLVNGKRRHASALIHVNTSVGRGTAGTDLNAIPLGAIKRIEILRDGASAQYGSDAIAGVINIVLKDDNEGGFRTNWGTTYSGDGDQFAASLDKGFRIGRDGTLHVTFEYRDRGRTNRAGLTGAIQYPDTGTCPLADCTTAQLPNKAALQDLYPDTATVILNDPDEKERNFNRRNFRIGDASSEQFGGVLHFSKSIASLWKGAEVYSVADVSRRTNESGGFYRRANQADRNPAGSAYPDGFLPLINTTIWDFSFGGGVTREFKNGLTVDLGVVHGGNIFNFEVTNSHNASFVSANPTLAAPSSADAGDLELYLTTVNLDFALPFPDRKMNVAWGAEYRRDNYQIEAGEEYSYRDYDGAPADGSDAGTACDFGAGDTGCGAPGIQVFPGFRPANEVDESRHAFAAYTDMEVFFTDWLMASPAVRYEHYSDFGHTVNGKLATKLDVADSFALRGSVSSGFRAPSMQQLYFNNVSTQFNSRGVAREVGTFRNDSAIARSVGIPELKQETSTNLSGGFVWQPFSVFTLTTDFYRIEVQDRIIVSGQLSSDVPGLAGSVTQALNDAGVSQAQFFMNAVDTETRGVDIVASWAVPFVQYGVLDINLLGSIIETRIRSVNLPAGLPAALFTDQDRSIIEEWQPRSRFVLSGEYEWERLSAQVRLSRYGSYTVTDGARQKFGPEYITDVQVGYDFASFGIFKIGANNLFDVTPNRNRIGQSRGGTIIDSQGNLIVDSPGVFQYSRRAAPFGFNGGFYYIGYEYRF